MGTRTLLLLFVASFVLVLSGCPDPGGSLSPPPIPTGLTVAGATATSLTVSWTPSDNALSYQVYRDTSSTGSFTTQAYNDATTSFADTGLASATTYYYKVQATGKTGSSALSGAVSGTTLASVAPPSEKPAKPSGLAVTALSSTALQLTWTDNANNEEGFSIFRGTDVGDPQSFIMVTNPQTKPVAANQTTYTDALVQPSTTYYYFVCAYNSVGLSDPSDLVQGVTLSASSLSAPTGVAATQGTLYQRIRLTWSSVSGAAKYNVYESDAANGDYELIGPTTSLSAMVNNVPAAQHWFFKVSACEASGAESNRSSVAEGWSAASNPMTAPTGLSASQGIYGDKVTLSWTAVTNSLYYNIYRATSASGTYTEIGFVSAPTVLTSNSTTSPASYPITPGTHYWYKLTAEDALGNESDQSGSAEGWAVGQLPAPTGLTASQGSHADIIALSWNAVTGAVQYNVYASATSGGTYGYCGAVSSASANVTGATPGVPFYYKVSGVNSAQVEGLLSSYAQGWVLGPPTGVTASDGTYTDKVVITWTAALSAEKYYVYRSTTSSGTYTMIGSAVTGTSYNDTTGTQGVTYYYEVKSWATSAGYCADFSAYDSGYRQVPPPGAPASVTAADGTVIGSVAVSWSSVLGATKYYVYRHYKFDTVIEDVGNTTSLSITDASCVPGKKYDYKVKAWNSGGYSSDSPEDEGWAGLAAPALISASQGLYSSWVRISWDPVTGANGFDVYRATAQTGVYTKIGQCTVLTAPYYYDSTATTGFGYYYKAMAYRTNSLNGETVYSAYSTFAYGWR